MEIQVSEWQSLRMLYKEQIVESTKRVVLPQGILQRPYNRLKEMLVVRHVKRDGLKICIVAVKFLKL